MCQGGSSFERGQVGGCIELLQFQAPACQQFRQFGGRALVAPRQTEPAGQALIQRTQALRLQLGVPGIAIERVHCVFSLCQRALQDLQRGDELRLDMRLRLQSRSGPSKLATGAVFGILQGLQRGFDSFSQGLRI